MVEKIDNPVKSPEKQSNLISRMTGNGFFLLVAGAILTSIIVPRITAISDRSRLLRENRLNMQREIIKNVSLTDRQINAMLTRLEIFNKDNIRLNPKKGELKEAQKRLQEEINQLYLTFNNNAWWWYRDLYQEAMILQLSTQDTLAGIQSDMYKYRLNIIQSTDVLSHLWQRCISATYGFKPNGFLTVDGDSTREKLSALQNERCILMTKLITYFSPE